MPLMMIPGAILNKAGNVCPLSKIISAGTFSAPGAIGKLDAIEEFFELLLNVDIVDEAAVAPL